MLSYGISQGRMTPPSSQTLPRRSSVDAFVAYDIGPQVRIIRRVRLRDGIDLAEVRSVFADVGVRYAVLFGSYATGSESQGSDIDICVRVPDEYTRRERFRRRNRIDALVQSAADPFVDVSDLQALPDSVALNALQDGTLLYGDHQTKTADERRPRERRDDRVADRRTRSDGRRPARRSSRAPPRNESRRRVLLTADGDENATRTRAIPGPFEESPAVERLIRQTTGCRASCLRHLENSRGSSSA